MAASTSVSAASASSRAVSAGSAAMAVFSAAKYSRARGQRSATAWCAWHSADARRQSRQAAKLPIPPWPKWPQALPSAAAPSVRCPIVQVSASACRSAGFTAGSQAASTVAANTPSACLRGRFEFRSPRRSDTHFPAACVAASLVLAPSTITAADTFRRQRSTLSVSVAMCSALADATVA